MFVNNNNNQVQWSVRRSLCIDDDGRHLGKTQALIRLKDNNNRHLSSMNLHSTFITTTITKRSREQGTRRLLVLRSFLDRRRLSHEKNFIDDYFDVIS